MANRYPKPTPEPDTHPAQCTVDRFPVDTLLRTAGYIIHSRPRAGAGGVAVDLWTLGGDRYGRGGELFTVRDALLRIQRDENGLGIDVDDDDRAAA